MGRLKTACKCMTVSRKRCENMGAVIKKALNEGLLPDIMKVKVINKDGVYGKVFEEMHEDIDVVREAVATLILYEEQVCPPIRVDYDDHSEIRLDSMSEYCRKLIGFQMWLNEKAKGGV